MPTFTRTFTFLPSFSLSDARAIILLRSFNPKRQQNTGVSWRIDDEPPFLFNLTLCVSTLHLFTSILKCHLLMHSFTALMLSHSPVPLEVTSILDLLSHSLPLSLSQIRAPLQINHLTVSVAVFATHRPLVSHSIDRHSPLISYICSSHSRCLFSLTRC